MIAMAGVLLVACGNANAENDVDKQKEVSVAKVAATKQIEAPTERTIGEQDREPWLYYSSDLIIDHQNDGEIVFVFSDAEDLENYILGYLDSEVPKEKENADSWAAYLEAFIQGTEKYQPNQKEYFDKIRELQTAFKEMRFDDIAGIIKEAKELRKGA